MHQIVKVNFWSSMNILRNFVSCPKEEEFFTTCTALVCMGKADLFMNACYLLTSWKHPSQRFFALLYWNMRFISNITGAIACSGFFDNMRIFVWGFCQLYWCDIGIFLYWTYWTFIPECLETLCWRCFWCKLHMLELTFVVAHKSF